MSASPTPSDLGDQPFQGTLSAPNDRELQVSSATAPGSTGSRDLDSPGTPSTGLHTPGLDNNGLESGAAGLDPRVDGARVIRA